MPFFSPEFLDWTRNLPIAVTIRNSSWMLPVIESAHLLGYAGIIGCAAAIDLRILNLGLRRQTASQISSQLAPWTAASLLLSIVTGTLLFTYKPDAFARNGAFPYKLSFVAVAILFHYSLLRGATRSAVPGRGAKLVAIGSLALWLAVALAGMAVSLELF
jgi:hypothetical protein